MQARTLPQVASGCPSCGYLAEATAGRPGFCPRCGRRLAAGGDSSTWFGEVIADRYRLLTLLGEGGMGAVYKAEHIRMGKALALKLLRGDFANEPGAVARFRAEAQIVSRLSHPHTIAVFDFGEVGRGEGFYLAMEYVPGKDLATVLREERSIPEQRAAWIGQQVLGSLAEAHDAGIVHRDMKPANVMVMRTRSGEDFAKVLDFGIAKLRGDAPGRGTGTVTATAAAATATGAIVGTPTYLSPEQARGEPSDARADLYSVGVLLYELVAGRPPFVAPEPMAIVDAHMRQEPPPLAELAPGVSPRYAEVVHRSLRKDLRERWQCADDMRDALLALGDGASPAAAPSPRRITMPDVTGELQIANREDFLEFERQLRSLRRSRVAAPAALAVFLALAAGLVWRWSDVYAVVARRWPEIAAAVPTAVRPADLYDGIEHEPNDSFAQANPLPIPPGPDGRRAEGMAVMRGHIGARIDETTGDVDVFRIDVPDGVGRSVLVAEWSSDAGPDGIRGLDVALTLNRGRAGPGGRFSARLVANVDRGGPGRPESLAAAVEPGTYYLAVRERHPDNAPPVERPKDRYRLEVRLRNPRPGEEIEPNDAPDALEHPALRYPEWRALAERNPLAEGIPLRATTSVEDPDTFAVIARGADAPELVAAIPEPGLALSAELWVPDEVDRATPKPKDRVRFEAAGAGAPGEVLLVPLPSPLREDAPDLLQLRASLGEGGYDVVALGRGPTSGAAVVALLGALADRGYVPQALELAAAFDRHVPSSPARRDVLLAAGAIAARAAGTLRAPDLGRFQRVAVLLGAEALERHGAQVRYRGAFEARVDGEGVLAEEAALRLVPIAAPCTPAAVAARAGAFLGRFPSSERAGEARLWEARALEDAFWRSGTRDRDALERVLDAWRRAAEARIGGDEPARRLAALTARKPVARGAVRVCR